MSSVTHTNSDTVHKHVDAIVKGDLDDILYCGSLVQQPAPALSVVEMDPPDLTFTGSPLTVPPSVSPRIQVSA